MYTIIKFNRARKIRGFNFQRGFLAVFCNGQVIAATSGFCDGDRPHGDDNSRCFIYRRHYGRWVGDWVPGSDFSGDSPSPLTMLADAALELDYRYLSLLREREERDADAADLDLDLD